MDRQEYLRVQMLAVTLGQEVAKLPLEDVIAKIAVAESMGPVLDSRLYKQGIDQLERYKELATALLTVKSVSLRHQREAQEMFASPDTAEQAWQRVHNFLDQEKTNGDHA